MQKPLLSSVLAVTRVLAGAGVCAGLFAACDVNIHEGKASVAVFSAEATDDWTHHYPLSRDGLVEVVNINGPVDIAPGTAGTVDVHATITAKALTDEGAREILSKGKVLESSDPGRVHIETMMPRAVHGSYVVHYAVRVPPGTRTDVSTTNGALSASGLDGKLKVTAVNGKVQLDNMGGTIDGVVANGSLTARLSRVTAEVRLEVTNGSLALEIPAAARANLSARIVNGGLTISGLPLEEPTGRRIRNLETPLNGGGPQISARVTNGRLSIEGK